MARSICPAAPAWGLPPTWRKSVATRSLPKVESGMRQDVIARQVAAMRESGLDALVSISPENFAYVTGFVSPTQPLMRWRHAMAVVTAEERVALVAVDMEASTIRAKTRAGTKIAVWHEFKFDAMSVLAEFLETHGLA